MSKNPEMATNSKSLLPIIDISALLVKCDDPNMMEDAGVAEVVGELDRACRDVGFFYVIGHGVSESLMKKVKEMSHQFFELLYEEKLKIKITPEAGYRFVSLISQYNPKRVSCLVRLVLFVHNGGSLVRVELYRGYQRIGVNFTSGKQDLHEAIDCYKEFKRGQYGETGKVLEGPNRWPENPQEYKELMNEYIKLCTNLSRNILRGISLALGGSPYEFEGKMVGDPFWVMRIIGYPGVNQENNIGCGAHTDYGLLTLINQDDDKTALQVKNLAGDWISAIPIPGSFICNIGDMLKILSNSVYESTLHRVINNSPRYRVCVAFFYETNFDANVEPLDIFKDKYPGDKRSQVFKKVVYGEHLVNKVKTTFANL